MKKLLATLALVAAPTLASAESYECTTTEFGTGGWVSNIIYLEYDPKRKQGFALDYFINQVHGDAIPVQWKQRSATSYQFNWKVTGAESSNGEDAILSYRVILFKDRMEFSLSGRNHGYENIITGRGKCKVM